jgi:hypothetical protein
MVLRGNAMPSTRKDPRNNRRGEPNATDFPCKELPTGTPHSERGDFISQTIAIWQKRTERKLTREDGREIVENITGFFSILQEWERKERAAEDASHSPDSDGRRRSRQTQGEGAKSVTLGAIKAES